MEGEAEPEAASSNQAPVLTERPSTYPPHHKFCLAISSMVKALFVRDKRQIYVSMRSGQVTPNSFFLKFGLSAADYSVWQILNDNPRRIYPKQQSCDST